MFNVKGRLCACYCNNIEANRQVYFELLDICISRDEDVSEFPVGDSLFQPADLIDPASLNFNHYHFTIIQCNDIPLPIS